MILDRIVGRRGLLLTVYLPYVALSNAWWAFRSIDTYWDLVSHRDPRGPHWPFLALGVLSACAIVAVAGLWRMRKWGLYLYLVCWASALGIGIYLEVPFQLLLWNLANVALLGLLVAPRRDLLR